MTSSTLDYSGVLRMIASLKVWTLRTEQIQTQLEQELAATQENLMHATNELQEATKLADILYEVCQNLGLVTDHLIKQKGVEEDKQGSQSFEAVLNAVVHRLDSSKVINHRTSRCSSEASTPFELANQDQAPQKPAVSASEM
ncbi:uncharacterized protein N7443_001765 [Penicillium atrosanguineum]|nr:uncharacterized protein N7443_008181 [Penicillium atrosanguineum]XP_056743662.1 uncharacterized protein N7443_001765 [Penicillium atrosanguineum]KAJ5117859.1 hypothetical protein N7526_010882 [Penicillium atrosanguineum]KAJ5297288.1 hypothetical protein N7443_008181 [Penicillium atrosanguineum]KAJ5309304.1 hypothetical protein N7443_001765 [Penicillium atrosanguineum]